MAQQLTIQDCMERHHKSYNTIINLFRKRGSPAYRVGREWQVDEEKWNAYLMKLSEASKS